MVLRHGNYHDMIKQIVFEICILKYNIDGPLYDKDELEALINEIKPMKNDKCMDKFISSLPFIQNLRNRIYNGPDEEENSDSVDSKMQNIPMDTDEQKTTDNDLSLL